MAAEVTVTTNTTITGLGAEKQLKNTFTSGTTPAEVTQVNAVISTTAWAIDMGGCSISTVFALEMKATSGNVWVELHSTTCASTTAQMYIPEGETAYIPMNNQLAVVTSAYINGDAATAAVEYLVAAE